MRPKKEKKAPGVTTRGRVGIEAIATVGAGAGGVAVVVNFVVEDLVAIGPEIPVQVIDKKIGVRNINTRCIRCRAPIPVGRGRGVVIAAIGKCGACAGPGGIGIEVG